MVFGLLSKVLAKLGGDGASQGGAEEISKVVPLSDCPSECEACLTKFPASLKIDTLTNLNNSTSPYKLHLLVPTGKTDWSHAATDTSGSVENTVARWAGSSTAEKIIGGGKIKVSVSSLHIEEDYNESENDVLILPYFVWIKKITPQNVTQALEKVIPEVIKLAQRSLNNEQNVAEPEEQQQQVPIALPEKVGEFAVAPAPEKAFVFLCSHRTRDKRCGITAPIMKKEFDTNLREHDLLRDFGDDRPGGVDVLYINHVGGHKYAANVLIYLKTGEMIWLARMNPANVKPMIDETILGGGKVWPDKVRIVQRACAISW